MSSELFGTFHRLAWEGLHAIADEKYQLSSTTFPLRHFCLQVFMQYMNKGGGEHSVLINVKNKETIVFCALLLAEYPQTSLDIVYLETEGPPYHSGRNLAQEKSTC